MHSVSALCTFDVHCNKVIVSLSLNFVYSASDLWLSCWQQTGHYVCRLILRRESQVKFLCQPQKPKTQLLRIVLNVPDLVQIFVVQLAILSAIDKSNSSRTYCNCFISKIYRLNN